MTSALRRTGLALAVLYAVVAAVTSVVAAGVGRPLFDGFAPPVPYRYVNPPPELAADNEPPQSAETTITLEEGGSEAANASTTDAQVIVALPTGAIPANPPDTAVDLRLVPLAPEGLGPLPPDLRAVSNAYQLVLTYQPSGSPVTTVATSATIALTGASQGDTLLYSADGREWRTTAARPFGNTHGMTGPVQGAGYYLVAASPAVTTTTVAGTGGGSGGAAIGVTAVVALAAMGVAAYSMMKRRQSKQAQARSRQQRRQAERRGKRP